MTIEKIISIMENVFTYKNFDEEFLEEFCDRYNLSFRYGETRWVIYCDSWKEVLKIPRYNNIQEDINHCDIELEYYEYSKEWGLEKIFLPIRKVAVLRSGVEIYAQTKFTCAVCETGYRKREKIEEKVNFDYSRLSKVNAMEKRWEMYDADRISPIWWARAWQIYGKVFMRKLQDFTQELELGDLHGNNVGWLGNQPIILDYAGFNSCDLI